jgi:hypothetical protein
MPNDMGHKYVELSRDRGGEMRVEVARRGAKLGGGDKIQELLKNMAWAIHAGEMFFRDGECQVCEISVTSCLSRLGSRDTE